jgi:hypothetical protein
MKEIIIQMGTERITRQYPSDATIGDVVGDPSVRAMLGYGDNVRALILGVEQEFGTVAPAGCTIRVETKANTKNV